MSDPQVLGYPAVKAELKLSGNLTIPARARCGSRCLDETTKISQRVKTRDICSV